MSIELSNLSVRRGDFELAIPSLSVKPGQVVGIVGPNGAGKSTLLRVLAGLLKRDSGQVAVLGSDPGRDPVAVRLRTGFVAPEMTLFELKTRDLLTVVSGYYPSWDTEFADELFQRFELDETKKAGDLSLGQGMRLRLLLGMAFRPKVLLLDEPASGLDLAARHSLMQLVMEAVSDGETSILISSHRLGDVKRLSERLLVLDGGRVVTQGATDELVGDDRTLEEALIEWGAA